MTVPSNQLLSKVLNLTVINAFPSIEGDKFTNMLTVIYTDTDSSSRKYYNIHEFAQLAKQWATNHSYQIYSKSTRNVGVAKIKKLKPGAKRKNLILCEIQPTEVEAIIAAAEWVLQEINKCN